MNTKPTCEAIRGRLTLYLLDDLDMQTQTLIRDHLAHCDACRTYADKLAPTLDLLQEALPVVPDAPATLAAAYRKRIIQAYRNRPTTSKPIKPRKPLILRFHVLEIAAVFIGALMIIGFLMPASQKATDRARQSAAVRVGVETTIMEPQPMGALEEIQPDLSSDVSGLAYDEGGGAGPKPGTENGAATAGGDLFVFSEGVEPPAPDSAPAPSEPAASPKPAEFDSVAMVKSPVILRGLHGGRSAGERTRRPEIEEEDIPIDVVDAADTPDISGAEWKFKASEKLRRTEAAQKVETERVYEAAARRRRDAFENKQNVEVADKEARERRSGDFLTLDGGAAAGSDRFASGFTAMEGTTGEEEAPESYSRPVGEASQNQPADEPLMESLRGAQVKVDDTDETDDDNSPFSPRFAAAGVNPFVSAVEQAFSTFSIDVDTASYTVARNYMLGGRLPPPEAVRTEEFVNFFDYAYDPPIGKTFGVTAEIAPSRFGRGLHLLKLGVKGRRLGREEQRPAVLTFLIDSSGSMDQPDRMGLVRAALNLLLDELADTDQVAIIQFDNRARLILAHTPAAQREKIRAALDGLQCSGGTNLEVGMLQAYELARKAFVPHGENRILLLSDGVVNLGETASGTIAKRIQDSRQQGLYLSVFGFGMGTYDDAMLKTLASNGNGAYAFIDAEQEARRVFVDDLSATLHTIAEDVKIQVEFNPKRVQRYRQLGYEQRQLTKGQFRDDSIDAGEVGSGQSVTALYELDLVAAQRPVPYTAQAASMPTPQDWLAVVRVRYRRMDNGRIEEIEQRIYERDIQQAFDDASVRFRLAAGVAAFAEILRGSPFVQGVEFDDVAAVLRPVALDLHLDARIRELVQIVETAGGLAR